MRTIKNQKKARNKTIHILASVLLLLSQISPIPGYSAEPLLPQNPTGSLVPVTSTSSTSTQTQPQTPTQTQTTSTEFLSQQTTLSSSASPSTTVPGAYGGATVEDLEGNDYVITAADGTKLVPANEVSFVKVTVNPDYPRVLTNTIKTGPVFSTMINGTTTYDFVTLKAGQQAILLDAITSRAGGNFEPIQDLPNFVMINGNFTPLTVTRGGGNPLGWPQYDVSFTVSSLKADGTDKIKFLSPYDATRVLARESAINADASVWAHLGYGAYDVSPAYVTFISTGHTTDIRSFETNLAADAKVLDYYFVTTTVDTTSWEELIIKTEDKTVAVNVATGSTRLVTWTQKSPDKNYSVTWEQKLALGTRGGSSNYCCITQDYLILHDSGGNQLANFMAEDDQAAIGDFTVTNKGVYYAGDRRSNRILVFIPFSNFTEGGKKPIASAAGIAVSTNLTDIRFVSGMPGVVDFSYFSSFNGHIVTIVTRVDIEKNVILQVSSGGTLTTYSYKYDAAGGISEAVSIEYNSNGTVKRSTVTTYFSDGKKKNILAYLYDDDAGGKRYTSQIDNTEFNDDAGNTPQWAVTTTYYSSGIKKTSLNYLYYANSTVPQAIYYYQYESRGIISRFTITTYSASGQVTSSWDYQYYNGVLWAVYYNGVLVYHHW